MLHNRQRSWAASPITEAVSGGLSLAQAGAPSALAWPLPRESLAHGGTVASRNSDRNYPKSSSFLPLPRNTAHSASAKLCSPQRSTSPQFTVDERKTSKLCSISFFMESMDEELVALPLYEAY